MDKRLEGFVKGGQGISSSGACSWSGHGDGDGMILDMKATDG